MLSNLAMAFLARFKRAGELADLDQAIITGRQAVDICPSDDASWPMYLSNLGIALRDRFVCTGELADLDQAIIIGRQSVDATPGVVPDATQRPKCI